MMHTQLADASDYVKKSFDITESSADNLFAPIKLLSCECSSWLDMKIQLKSMGYSQKAGLQ